MQLRRVVVSSPHNEKTITKACDCEAGAAVMSSASGWRLDWTS